MRAALSGFADDLRFALRGLWRDRAYGLAAVGMLAVAIGLHATVSTIVDTVLFRGLPLVARNDRVLYLGVRPPNGPWGAPYQDFQAWRDQAHSFAGLAFGAGGTATFRGPGGPPLELAVSRVTPNTLGLLGVRPAVGRDFAPADAAPGAPPVAIISDRFWETRFGRRADIAGTLVHIGGVVATIVGVLPPGFALVYEQPVWVALNEAAHPQVRTAVGSAFGRLRDDATADGARAEIETINRRLQAADPATDRSTPPLVQRYAEAYNSADTALLYGCLWAGAWLVLLIACANVVNLTLARTTSRWRELATRVALGAGRWRLARQMLAENLLLAGTAGAIGWAMAVRAVPAWAAATASRYLVLDYSMGAGTVAYVAAVALVVAIVCAAAPIARVTRMGVEAGLSGDGRGTTQGPRAKRVTNLLVAGQMALAIVLLSGAGVLARSLLTLVHADTGVRDAAHVLVGSVLLPADNYPSAEARASYFTRVDASLRGVAGVETASVATTLPVSWAPPRRFEIEGRPVAPGREEAAAFLSAGTDYFRVMGVNVVEGRGFSGADRAGTPPVAIVNESFVQTYWPDRQAIGRRLRLVAQPGPAGSAAPLPGRREAGPWLVVVGVVPNILQGDPTRQHFKPLIYVPLAQEPPARRAFFAARTSVPPAQVASAVRAAVQGVDADVPVEDFGTLQASFAFDRDFMDLEHADLGKYAVAGPVFAGTALVLALAGLYAVVAYAIGRRTKEIGVRMAIGATAADIWRLVLRDGLAPVALGTAAGFAAALAVNQLLRSQLIGVSPSDPATMAAAPLVLIGAAVLACQLPARRAMRVDPAVALRHD